MKNKYRRNPIVLLALIFVSIDIIGMLWVFFTDPNQDINSFGLFLILYSPLAYYGYKLWAYGRISASIPLSVFLLFHGVFFLLMAGVAGDGSVAIFAILHILIAISLIFYNE